MREGGLLCSLHTGKCGGAVVAALSAVACTVVSCWPVLCLDRLANCCIVATILAHCRPQTVVGYVYCIVLF